MLSFDNSIIPEQLSKWSEIENMMFTATRNSLNIAKDLIKKLENEGKSELIVKQFINLLLAVSLRRRLSFDELSDFCANFSNYICRYKISNFVVSKLSWYLHLKGIIPKSILMISYSVSKEQMRYGVEENSIGYFIVLDDVEKLVFSLSGIETKTCEIKADNKSYSIIDYSAKCGAVKSFKYLLVNDCALMPKTLKYAIKGGNEEIIQILVQNGFVFNYFLETAIKYHHNEIGNWLIENYRQGEIDPFVCLRYENTLGFCYFLFNGIKKRTILPLNIEIPINLVREDVKTFLEDPNIEKIAEQAA